LQCGGRPTASIPKTRDQPEEASSEPFRHCGNNASTGISRVPLTRQQMRGPTSHRQHIPHSVQGTSGSARTNNPNGVPAGRPHPADSTPQSSNRGAQNMRLHSARWQDRQRHAAESGSFRSRRLASLVAPLRVSSLRCGPLRGVESKTAGARHVGYSRRERTRSLIIGSRSSPCMYLFVSFLVSR
jgi:hypothetical protein